MESLEAGIAIIGFQVLKNRPINDFCSESLVLDGGFKLMENSISCWWENKLGLNGIIEWVFVDESILDFSIGFSFDFDLSSQLNQL